MVNDYYSFDKTDGFDISGLSTFLKIGWPDVTLLITFCPELSERLISQGGKPPFLNGVKGRLLTPRGV